MIDAPSRRCSLKVKSKTSVTLMLCIYFSSTFAKNNDDEISIREKICNCCSLSWSQIHIQHLKHWKIAALSSPTWINIVFFVSSNNKYPFSLAHLSQHETIWFYLFEKFIYNFFKSRIIHAVVTVRMCVSNDISVNYLNMLIKNFIFKTASLHIQRRVL